MIKFTARLLLKNKVLWAWPAVVVFFTIVTGVWGDIIPATESQIILIGFGELKAPAGLIFSQLLSLITLIAVIGLPSHLSKNINPERAALILSKPVSRSDFYLSDFAAMLLVSVFYTVITIIALAVMMIFKAGLFPMQFLLGILLFVPLYLLAIYIAVALFLILTDSYLASVILAYIAIPLLAGVFLKSKELLGMLGFQSDALQGVIDVFAYLIPSTAGVQELMLSVLTGGFSAFDGGLFAFTLISFLPFFLLGLYLMRRKQF